MHLKLTASLIAFALGAGAVLADASAAIVADLRAQGYRIVTQERTWLGRKRVVAENDQLRREIVFVPGSGEILRDMSTRIAGKTDSRDIALTNGNEPVVDDGLDVSPPAAVTADPPSFGSGVSLGDPVAVQSVDVTQ